jgi:hypothetical protein
MVINLISDQGVTPPPTTLPVVVGGLAKAPSSAALDYCKSASEIPTNINDVFIVPVGTQSESGGNIPNAGAGDFDCYQPLVTTTNAATLLTFYKSQLEARGWSLFSQGSSNGSPQSLFQKAGNDGFYWVVGITVTKSAATSCTGPSGSIRTPKRSEPVPFGHHVSVQAHDHSAKLSG